MPAPLLPAPRRDRRLPGDRQPYFPDPMAPMLSHKTSLAYGAWAGGRRVVLPAGASCRPRQGGAGFSGSCRDAEQGL